MASRFGIDVGGTFTDLLYWDDASGELVVGKVDTVVDAPERGVIEAASTYIPEAGLRASEFFLHGTTAGLNSILTRTGASVGALVTRGFRDMLEIRRGDRREPWDLLSPEPPPLVARSMMVPISGRMLFDGSEHLPLDEQDIRDAAHTFTERGVESVAVVFLHSYANPSHELRAAEVLRDAGFVGQISLSHQTTGEYREYERASTTVIDAYVRPRMSRYLTALETGLRASGFDGSMLLTRSGGGAFTFDQAGQRPFETIMSGPVAGAEGAAELARAYDLGDVIAADVGGTSFDTTLITQGRPQLRHQGTVDGMVVQSPWVDVRSIGAGGGSIAWIDIGGLLHVGPQSAGSDPGPAGYGRGGSQPTVTDAAFVLGMLGPGDLAGGRRTLDVELSRAAFAPLAEQLELTIEDVARGTMRIVTAHMANATREITIEQGIDPRECTLMPFGGAGPLFGVLVAQELGMTKLLIPPHAGNFSAWGMLGADLTHVGARTRIMAVDEAALAAVDELTHELFDAILLRADERSVAHGQREVRLDMRYTGQEHTISVAVSTDASGTLTGGVEELLERFRIDYERTFAHTMEEAIEIASVRATLRTPLPRRAAPSDADVAEAAPERTMRAYSFAEGRDLDFQVIDRARVGASLAGPAIVLEPTTTTYLDAGFVAAYHPSGSMVVTTAATTEGSQNGHHA